MSTPDLIGRPVFAILNDLKTKDYRTSSDWLFEVVETIRPNEHLPVGGLLQTVS